MWTRRIIVALLTLWLLLSAGATPWVGLYSNVRGWVTTATSPDDAFKAGQMGGLNPDEPALYDLYVTGKLPRGENVWVSFPGSQTCLMLHVGTLRELVGPCVPSR
jgi:hypothetical protein